jgi:hypothetical protein
MDTGNAQAMAATAGLIASTSPSLRRIVPTDWEGPRRSHQLSPTSHWTALVKSPIWASPSGPTGESVEGYEHIGAPVGPLNLYRSQANPDDVTNSVPCHQSVVTRAGNYRERQVWPGTAPRLDPTSLQNPQGWPNPVIVWIYRRVRLWTPAGLRNRSCQSSGATSR